MSSSRYKLCENSQHNEQAWLKDRLGCITASMVYTLRLGRNGQLLKSADTYIDSRASELYSGKIEKLYGRALEHGKNYETLARNIYKELYQVDVKEVGFAYLLDKKYWLDKDTYIVGCSSDGLIGSKGMIEIKCPYTFSSFISQIGSPKDEYLFQIAMQLWVYDREWCDFFMFMPEFSDKFIDYSDNVLDVIPYLDRESLYMKRFHRDDEILSPYIAEIPAMVERGIIKLTTKINSMREDKYVLDVYIKLEEAKRRLKYA